MPPSVPPTPLPREAVCSKGHRFTIIPGVDNQIPALRFDRGPDWCMVCLNEALLRANVGRFPPGTATNHREIGGPDA